MVRIEICVPPAAAEDETTQLVKTPLLPVGRPGQQSELGLAATPAATT